MNYLKNLDLMILNHIEINGGVNVNENATSYNVTNAQNMPWFENSVAFVWVEHKFKVVKKYIMSNDICLRLSYS